MQDISNRPLRVLTELKCITESWLVARDIIAEADFSWGGATRVKAPLFADAIAECTETGSSLQANRQGFLNVVFRSTKQFFAGKDISTKAGGKRTELDSTAFLLKDYLAADAKVSVCIYAPFAEAEVLEALIPSDVGYSMGNGLDYGRGAGYVLQMTFVPG